MSSRIIYAFSFTKRENWSMIVITLLALEVVASIRFLPDKSSRE
jgi:hypothetical protein